MPRLSLPAPKSAEARCDRLIAQLYGSSAIVKFGRKGKRSPNTEGVPDRLYFAGRRFVFFEVKSATDYLSPNQTAFLTRVLALGNVEMLAGCGDHDDLLTLLNAPNPTKVGYAQLAEYSSHAARYQRTKALRPPEAV